MLIIDILKGILMGVANIMPGVSGGTLAISLGVYERIIEAISHIFQDFRKSFQTLFPLMTGMILGIVCFTYILDFLFVNYPFPVCLAFMGLILGGLPALYSAYKKNRHEYPNTVLFPPFHAFLFLSSAIITVLMSFTGDSLQNRAALSASPYAFAILFFLGMIAAGSMIIPGVSGTLILMILGYYYEILNAIKSALEAIRTSHMDHLLHSFVILIPFGAGIVLGIFLFSRWAAYLFRYYAAATYSVVIGLIVASPAAIFISTNALSCITPAGTVIGIALFISGLFITSLIGK